MLKNNTGIENMGENNSGNRNSGGGGGNGNMNTLKWFANRIGKRIYRDPYKCCAHCDEVAKNGLIISSKTHALYLFDTENDFGAEGIKLKYRDKK